MVLVLAEKNVVWYFKKLVSDLWA